MYHANRKVLSENMYTRSQFIAVGGLFLSMVDNAVMVATIVLEHVGLCGHAPSETQAVAVAAKRGTRSKYREIGGTNVPGRS